MRFFRGLEGREGFAALPALLLPVSKTAWEHAWAACYGWAGLLISKSAWKWALGGLSKSGAHSLDNAILVIGLPPIFFFVALFFYVRSRSKSFRSEKEAVAASDLDSASPADSSSRTRA
jgi:hypothetical protein